MSKYAEEDIIGVEDYLNSVAVNDSGGNVTGKGEFELWRLAALTD